jgi:hypothetical protein
MQKAVQAKAQLIAQLNENEMVMEELGRLDEGARVYKLIGPALIKQVRRGVCGVGGVCLPQRRAGAWGDCAHTTPTFKCTKTHNTPPPHPASQHAHQLPNPKTKPKRT